MARTQISAGNILDHSLTGASFREEMGFYDETKGYLSGVTLFWKGKQYITTSVIAAKEEGDLSVAPDVAVGNWNEIPVGDMTKDVYDTNGNGIVDSAASVNGLTVETPVPVGAVFTDTIYDDTAIYSLANSKEDDLGNPTADGYILSSTIAGVRSWIAPPGGGIELPVIARATNSTAQTISRTAVNINFSQASNTTHATFNTNSVDINTTGRYQIIARVNFENLNNTRTFTHFYMTNNNTEVPRSRGYVYTRNNADGDGSTWINMELDLTSGDNLEFLFRNDTNSNLRVRATESHFEIKYKG